MSDPSEHKGASNERTLSPIIDIFKRSWHIWTLLISLLVGMGIIQIDAVKFVIPSEYIGYILICLLLLWAVTTIIILSMRNHKLETAAIALQRELTTLQKSSSPSFFLEDIPLSALMAHVELRKQIRNPNPVKLEVFRLHCRIVGSGARKDADVTYYFKGTNIGGHNLVGIHLSVAGDNLVPFNMLGAKLYNLHSDPMKRLALRPRLEGPDSIRKDLFLPFVSPGVEHFETFELELTYTWPGTMDSKKDYWFLDNIDYEGATKEIQMIMEFVDIAVTSVRAYSVTTSSTIPFFLGVLPADPSDPRRFVFSKTNPDRDSYYLILYDTD